MKQGRTLILILLIGLTSGLVFFSTREKPLQSAARTKTETTSEQIINMIRTDGVKQTAYTLNKNKQWSLVKKIISTGQNETSEVISSLLPLANQTINRSIFRTARYNLPKYPVQILTTTEYTDDMPKNMFRLQSLCNASGMPASWRTKTRSSLLKLHDVRLASRVSECLKTLRKTASDI